ncbi:MAG: DUF1573 domain-containing protein [Schleiferiaceae bacterium]|nr:DUF1573 domain-containing protein [Schleiferiaceae bacterium]
MNKFLATAALAFASSLAMLAQEANPNAANITFENKTIDYGKLEKDANGEREFTFKNNGKEPLIISNCVGSCGCTVPQWPRTPIAPGATAAIKVKYDTRRVGRFQKTVTVQSNAANATEVLTIKGEILAPAAANTTPVNTTTGTSKVSK